MDARPGVTIAIPNWNHELLLPRSVHSALRAVAAVTAATGRPGEVIVVDDGSRDGSVGLLRQMEALHYRDGLRVLAGANNRGLAASRNRALAHARYRHVCFLDADNELLPENLPRFVRALDQTGAAGVYGNLLVRKAGSRAAHYLVSNEPIQPKIYEENYVDAFALFDRQQVLDVGGYESSCPAHEDYALWLHFLTNGRRVVFVPLVLGYYYVLPGSMIQADQDANSAAKKRARRIFDQLGIRGGVPCNTERLRYHPDLGYL